MKALSLPFSPRSRKLLCLAVCSLLIILTLALLPFFVEVSSRFVNWFTGLLPQIGRAHV